MKIQKMQFNRMNQMNMMRFGSQAVNKVNPSGASAAKKVNSSGGGANVLYGPNAKQGTGKDASSAYSFRKMLSDSRRTDTAAGTFQNTSSAGSIVTESFSYADSVRATRTKSKETALQLKKLRYNYKSISTQILRSKTSASARQVASKAGREVIRLKRQRQSGEYDDEELQAAIAHAQAMERVAKKKARHLQEEEMMKVTGGHCAGDLEEKAEQEQGLAENETQKASGADAAASDAGLQEKEMIRDSLLNNQDAVSEQMAQLQEEMRYALEEMTASFQGTSMENSMEDMVSELLEDMSDTMKEMLEDSGLADLTDSMTGAAQVEMDPADYKMMKIKHRCKELKEITKADAEYLKAVFDKLERMKGSGGAAVMGGGSAGVSAPAQGINLVSAPDAVVPSVSAAVPVMTGGNVDICL